jgi:pyrroline-5-carboxylate reductase
VPAYFFLFLQALEQEGVAFGFSPEMARHLALQTAWGSIHMAIESKQDLMALCEQIASIPNFLRSVSHLLTTYAAIRCSKIDDFCLV